MKSFEYYRVNKHNEVEYIKRFINGVSEKELEEMFRKHFLDGFITILLATALLNKGIDVTTGYLNKHA